MNKGETTSYDIDVEITVIDNNTALFKITNYYDNSTGVYSAEKF